MHVLVVEDEKKVAAFMRQALAEAGHVVDVEFCGRTGLDSALRRIYDLVILDQLLPEVTGTEICSQLRSCKMSVPILMVTARDAVADRVAGLDSGADDYLTKPFSIDELLARVRALRRRRDKVVASVLAVADLAVDLQSRSVSRAGRQIVLSTREYSLLEYLMHNAGRPLARTTIAEHVWGFDFDSGSNVIDVYISYLRHKIDDGFDVKLVRTLRGVGYQIG